MCWVGHRSSFNCNRTGGRRERRRCQFASSLRPDCISGVLGTSSSPERHRGKSRRRELNNLASTLLVPLARSVAVPEKTKGRPEIWAALMRCRRRPTLPRPLERSTIGAVGLNDRVRNGNGCGPYAPVASEDLFSKIESWGGRIRTCNFRINSPAVCQLTYTPVGTGRGQHTA